MRQKEGGRNCQRKEANRPWPLYFRESLSLGAPESNVGICTLWSRQEKVRTRLRGSLYCVMGNLYSGDGINYLLRNVLANPRIRYIVLCGADITGSGEALRKLFLEGLDERHRVKGTDTIIDANIEASAIELVRKWLKLIDLRGPISGEQLEASIEKLEKPLPPFVEQPLYFPEAEPHVETFPDNDNATVIRCGYVVEGWVKIIDAIMTFGRVEKTEHSLNQKEILNLVTVISHEDPDNIVYKDWLPFSLEHLQGKGGGGGMEGEAWLQFRLPLRDPVFGEEAGGKCGYYEQLAYTRELPDLSYTYGKRLWNYRGENQIFTMAERLKEALYTRRAVAILWDPEEDGKSDNPPCLNLLQASVRGGKLHFSAYFRSHDIYRAWPENAFALRKLQKFLGSRVGVKELGDLVIFSQSAHIYEDCWLKASDILRERSGQFRRGKYFKMDARGNFNIRLEDGLIRIYHYSPQGNLINSFSGKSAGALIKAVEPYVSLMHHALYLGQEIARAETALKLNLKYQQDGPIPSAMDKDTGTKNQG